MTDGKYEYTEYSPKKGAGDGIKEKLQGKGELLGLYRRESCSAAFYRIKFYSCGHECFIRSGKTLECNNKNCVSKKMSAKRKEVFNAPEYRAKLCEISKEVQSRPEVKEKHRNFFSSYWGQESNRQAQSKKKTEYFADEDNRKAQAEKTRQYFTNSENRERLSKSAKAMFKDESFMEKYLIGRAEAERKRQNCDEIFFLNMLEKMGIDYVWQVPLITDYGKGFILDFYIPCVDLYVNIDGSVHGIDYKYTNPIVEKKKAGDKELDDYCRTHNINLCHVSVKTLRSSKFDLKEVINL